MFRIPPVLTHFHRHLWFQLNKDYRAPRAWNCVGIRLSNAVSPNIKCYHIVLIEEDISDFNYPVFIISSERRVTFTVCLLTNRYQGKNCLRCHRKI